MKLVERLHKFERRIERGPKSQLVSLVIVVFIVSTGVGFLASYAGQMIARQAVYAKQQEIENLASERMGQRLEELKKTRFYP